MLLFESLALCLITVSLWFVFLILRGKRKEQSYQFPSWPSKTCYQHYTQGYTQGGKVIDLLTLFQAMVTTRILTLCIIKENKICAYPFFCLPVSYAFCIIPQLLPVLSHGISGICMQMTAHLLTPFR